MWFETVSVVQHCLHDRFLRFRRAALLHDLLLTATRKGFVWRLSQWHQIGRLFPHPRSHWMLLRGIHSFVFVPLPTSFCKSLIDGWFIQSSAKYFCKMLFQKLYKDSSKQRRKKELQPAVDRPDWDVRRHVMSFLMITFPQKFPPNAAWVHRSAEVTKSSLKTLNTKSWLIRTHAEWLEDNYPIVV